LPIFNVLVANFGILKNLIENWLEICQEKLKKWTLKRHETPTTVNWHTKQWLNCGRSADN